MRANFEPRSWEWIDQDHFVCRERSLSEDGERLISREVVTHAEKGVIIDQFYAERLYNEEAIRSLLDRAGLEAFRSHGELMAGSERSQDIGMMARRLLVTASAPRPIRVAPAKRIAHARVAVVMGDPRLPDDVKRDGHFNPEDIETIERLKRALSELDGYEFEYLDNHAALLGRLHANPPEFVLNLCDEGFDNNSFLEPHLPAYLEMLGIPYSGAGPTCLGLCYNKALVRAIAEALGIPVPLETYYTPADQSATLPATFPALVKPNFGDSSVGITQDAVVSCTEELVSYINVLDRGLPGRPVLIQELLVGPEYSVGVIGNAGLSVRFLPVLQVDYRGLPEGLPHILGYESKWIPESPYWTCIQYVEADLPDEVVTTLQHNSMQLFERLGCRDYARFDYRTDASGQVKLLEVNPNPGWCWDGKLNYMAGFDGMRYADLLRLIIETAQERLRLTASGSYPCGSRRRQRTELSVEPIPVRVLQPA
jgi:D-alanine-D-alanine ligase